MPVHVTCLNLPKYVQRDLQPHKATDRACNNIVHDGIVNIQADQKKLDEGNDLNCEQRKQSYDCSAYELLPEAFDAFQFIALLAY